jgi:hypothetical protein
LGLFDKVTGAELEVLERFFLERGAPVLHQISPLADEGLLPLLNQRGYRPGEFISVLYRPVGLTHPSPATRNERIQVREIHEGERAAWSELSVRGWAPPPEMAEFLRDLGRLHPHARGVTSFVAEREGEPIATASLCLWAGVALLAGASTAPEARRQGAQLALTEFRLRHAAENGCDLAMICAAPGGVSQRNAERHGFRIAYTRLKWRLETVSGRRAE